jgi:enoyl-[acyl-carrier protein] reductase I
MPDNSGLMRGKRGLIMGVANNRSIAWGVARACREHGADLAFTYQGDALKKRVEPLAEEVDGLVVGHCDVTDPKSLDAVFAAVQSAWGSLDFRCTPSRSPTRTSSTAATSIRPRTISPRRCW